MKDNRISFFWPIALLAAVALPLFAESQTFPYQTWQADGNPVYREPDFGFVKDPSIVKGRDGRYYMFYTGSAFGFQGASPPPWRIDYALSLDGVTWEKKGTAFSADEKSWEQGRVQAPSKPIWHDGKYWMFYAGGPRKPTNICRIGYATSVDLKNWTKSPGFVISHSNGEVNKANDPFVYFEDGKYYLFYTTYPKGKGREEEVFFRSSENLKTWSEPTQTGAWGEGAIVWKEKDTYYMLGAVGGSAKNEKYLLFSSQSLNSFQYQGPVRMNIPSFAEISWGHGDVFIDHGKVYLYFQGTNDFGKTFQIGRALGIRENTSG